MKKLFVLPALLFLFQTSFSQSLGISAGVKLLNIQKGDIFFVYQDESPVPDVLASLVELKGNKMAINLAVDYEGIQKPNQPYLLLRGLGYFGEIIGGDAAIGVGFNLPLSKNKKISLLPEISALVGFNKKDLGTLEVAASGSVYIQVNDTRYGNYEDVAVSLQNLYYGIRPGLSLNLPVGQKSFIRLYGGYLLSMSSSKISFIGNTSSEDNVEEFEKLKDRNLYFEVNGKSTQKAPFNANGLELRLGIFFPI